MTVVEFAKLWTMSYFEVIDYLINKYGRPKYPYTNNIKNGGKLTGLYVHHIFEYQEPSLSSDWAQKIFKEYQQPTHLCFCNLLEHFLLHLIILRDYHTTLPVTQSGIGQHLYPDCVQYFNNGIKRGNISPKYYENIKGSEEAFRVMESIYLDMKRAREGVKPIGTRYWLPEEVKLCADNINISGPEGVQQLIDAWFESQYPRTLIDEHGNYIKHARTISAIESYAASHGMYNKDKQRPFTKKADKILMKYFKTEDEKCFVRLKGYSYQACKQRVKELHLVGPSNNPWSLAEDNVIKEHYLIGGWKAVQEILPYRSNNSIIKRAKRVLGEKLKPTKTVRCIETNTIYNSLTEASKAVGISHTCISECLSGTQQTAGGYHWERVY